MEEQKRRVRRIGRRMMSLLLVLALCVNLRVPVLATQSAMNSDTIKRNVSLIRDGFYNEWENPFVNQSEEGTVFVEINGQTMPVACHYYSYEDEWAIKNISEENYVMALKLSLFGQREGGVYQEISTNWFVNGNKLVSERKLEKSDGLDSDNDLESYFPGMGIILPAKLMSKPIMERWLLLDEAAKKGTTMQDYTLWGLTILLCPFTEDASDPNLLHFNFGNGRQITKLFQYNPTQANRILSGRLTDVPEDSYCHEAVMWALRKGVTKGTTDTTFSPNDTCTRAQILTFIWRYNGEPEPGIPNPYTDVTEDAYFYKAALWAYEKGMVTGKEFQSDTPCTRASTMRYFWKLCGSPDTDSHTKFTDIPSGVDYAEAVAWAVSEQITNGTTDATFSPELTCTRGNIVTFLNRYSSRESIWKTSQLLQETAGKALEK